MPRPALERLIAEWRETATKLMAMTEEYADNGAWNAAVVVSRCANELAALLLETPGEAERPTWQPIATAPTDGTLVLVYRPKSSYDRVAIRSVRDWCGPKCCPHLEPMYWQPLPTPPPSDAPPPTEERP